MIHVEYASAAFSGYEDSFLYVQRDVFGGVEASAAPSMSVHPGGFVYRPQDPAGGVAASALFLRHGDQEFAFVMNDARVVLPELGKGSSVQYAHRLDGLASWDSMDGITGAKTIRVEYAGGALAHEIVVSPDGGIQLTHGAGPQLTLSALSVELSAHGSSILVSAAGVFINDLPFAAHVHSDPVSGFTGTPTLPI